MGSPARVLRTVEWAKRLGFKPVPLRWQSKASVTEKYVDLKYEAPPYNTWVNNQFGVGLVTGPAHAGPVDIDLDCTEAVYFASKFLPPTPAIFGRDTKKDSHYLYRVEEDALPKRAFLDPIQKSTIVEIRADGGHQTVMPGSLHETTGELIWWSRDEYPDPTRITAEKLDFAVKKVAIATLIVRHLWADGQRNEIVKHVAGLLFYMEWPIEEAISLIEAVMEYTGDDDRTRKVTIVSTYRKGERGGKITGAKTLRAFLADDRIVDRILEWAGDDKMAFLQEYNERFACVMVGGKFKVVDTPVELGGQPRFMSYPDFQHKMAADKLQIPDDKGKVKSVPKARIWYESHKRRQYERIEFLPGEEDPVGVYNLWTGWGVDPEQEGECKAWLDLLYYPICGQDDKMFNWMLSWFANLIREPQNKPPTSPVIIGRQGAGKSLLVSYFGKILGAGYVTVTQDAHVHGKFNSHLSTCLLLHSEEALYGGDVKNSNNIKGMISGDRMQLEKKGVDVEEIKSFMRVIFTSNHLWAAPVEHDDRRFTVINLDKRMVDTSLAALVVEEMKNGGPSALFRHLTRKFKYDPSVARTNLKNEAGVSLKAMSLSPIAMWWFETLKQGSLLPDFLSWASKPAGQEWPTTVSSPALHLAMVLFNRARGRTSYLPEQIQFAALLNEMTDTKLDRKQKYYANPMADDIPREVKMLPAKQYSIVNMPPLAECRKAFERYMKQEIEWPEEAENEDKPAFLKF